MLRLESQSSAGIRMQPYPPSPDLVWPGQLHGTGCLSAGAMDTGFPTVVWRLCLGPVCGWVWVSVTPPALAGVLGGCVWVGAVSSLFCWLGIVVFVVGLGFWPAPHLSWLGLWDVRGCVRALRAPRRSRFRCAAWACVLGSGFRLRPASPWGGVGVCLGSCAPPAWSPAPLGWGCCAGLCGWGRAPRLLAGASGCVCVCACAPLVPRLSWPGCAAWACLLGSGLGCAPPFLVGLLGCVFSLGGGVLCFGFVVSVAGCPGPGSCGLCPPIPSLSGCVAGSLFLRPCVVCVRAFSLFPVGRCSWLGVAGFGWVVLLCPVGGSCLRCPLGGGVWPPLAVLVGGLVAVGPSRPPPPVFFLGGGLPVPPSAFPGLPHALVCIQCGLAGCCWWLGSAWPCPGPMGRVGYVHVGLGAPSCWARLWLCRLGGCARRFRAALGQGGWGCPCPFVSAVPVLTFWVDRHRCCPWWPLAGVWRAVAAPSGVCGGLSWLVLQVRVSRAVVCRSVPRRVASCCGVLCFGVPCRGALHCGALRCGVPCCLVLCRGGPVEVSLACVVVRSAGRSVAGWWLGGAVRCGWLAGSVLWGPGGAVRAGGSGRCPWGCPPWGPVPWFRALWGSWSLALGAVAVPLSSSGACEVALVVAGVVASG